MIELRFHTEDDRVEVAFEKITENEKKIFSSLMQIWDDTRIKPVKQETPQS